MKIAIVMGEGADPSGVERVIPCFLWLVERLTRGGDDLHVFCLSHGKQPGTWPLLGATIHNAGGQRYVVRLFRQILTEHRRSPFDVIHTLWSMRANLTAIAAAKWLNLPVLLYYGTNELAALPDIPDCRRQLSAKGRFWYRLAAAGADCIGAQSSYIVELARKTGVSTERVPLGVALDRWPPRPPLRRLPGAPARLLHVASFHPVKDHDTLLRAMAHLKAMGIAFELDLIGCGPGEAAVRRQVADLALSEQVRFPGFMRHSAQRPYFEAADLLLLTSRYEAGPLVVLEAAIVGVPTVGTNVGHLFEWAPAAARVVEPCDSVGLAQAVAAVLSNEDLRMRLAAQAHERALAENADVTARRFRQIYSELRK